PPGLGAPPLPPPPHTPGGVGPPAPPPPHTTRAVGTPVSAPPHTTRAVGTPVWRDYDGNTPFRIGKIRWTNSVARAAAAGSVAMSTSRIGVITRTNAASVRFNRIASY